MRHVTTRTRTAAAALIIAVAMAVASCGNSSSGSSATPSTSSGSSDSASAATSSGGAPSTTTSGSSAAALAQATAALAPYTGHPSAFPVDVPLTAKPGNGKKLAMLQCSTPICALIAQAAVGAAQALGVPMTVTKAGASAQALQAAMASIISSKPAGVLIPAADPLQFRAAMGQLQSLNIPVVSQGVTGTGGYPAIKASILGDKAATLAGTLLASWVVQRNGAKPSVFYTIPELSFSAFIESGYKAQMATLCPSCSVRYEKIDIATIGNTAPATVVSDLQAHPDTATAVFGSEEAADGLPAALKVAGLKVDTVGFAPDPAVLGYIKSGEITAGLGYDNLTETWVSVDEIARLSTGQKLTTAEANDENVMQILEQKDITFDPTHGYSGYPDVAARFAKLWSNAKAQ